MRSLSLAALLSTVLVATACSNDNSTSLTSEAGIESKPNPVIVTMGGFNSCESINGELTPKGNERWEKGERLSNKFATGRALWLRSCYDKWGTIHYLSSLSPTVVREATIDTLDNYIATISYLSDQGKNPVFIIGHSHGGWLALTTSYRLPAYVGLKSLVTVDPISPRHCTPANYFAALASPVISGIALAGCREAPSDITNNMRGDILSRLPDNNWRHYYQRNFLPLSSSEFPGTAQPRLSQDVSPFLSVFPSGAHSTMNAHVGIDQLSLIWYSFEVSIDSALSEG